MKNLKKSFENIKSAVVAFSGGADSAVVLDLAVKYLGKDSVVAVTCVNFNIFTYEINKAYKIAEFLEVSWKPFMTSMSSTLFSNDPMKCYFCKKSIFSKIDEIKISIGFDVILDGTNLDDSNEFRPGMKALKEIGVKSVLLDNGLGKDFVEKYISDSKLSRFDFYPQSCIATRIRKKSAVIDDFKKIEVVEGILRKNIPDIRIRLYEKSVDIERKSVKNFSPKVIKYIIETVKPIFPDYEIYFNGSSL